MSSKALPALQQKTASLRFVFKGFLGEPFPFQWSCSFQFFPCFGQVPPSSSGFGEPVNKTTSNNSWLGVLVFELVDLLRSEIIVFHKKGGF